MRLFLFLALGQMLFLTACTGQAQKAKINGLSFVGSQALPSDSCWQTVLYVNANTISLMPYAYGKNNETKLVSHTAWQWSGESYQGIAHCVKAGKERGLNVIIKPHLWLGWEDYTGKLQQKNEEDWKVWSEQYNAYVIQFAKLAAQNDLQYFCLANEMESYWRNYPSGFEALIDSCKKIFRGNLIYASNWDEFSKFPFWNKLDVIGINAYFPLENEQAARQKWTFITQELELFSDSLSRPILFTELGYRSLSNPFKEPWEFYKEALPDEAAQAKAWEIFFQEVYPQKWLLGVLVWKWFPHYREKSDNTGFTPQNKAAEKVIANYFQAP